MHDVKLGGLRVGVAHVHVLGELPVPQLLVVLVALLEVEPQLGCGGRIAGREQRHAVAAGDQLVAQQGDQLLDRVSGSPVNGRPHRGDLRDPQPLATGHRRVRSRGGLGRCGPPEVAARIPASASRT